VVGLAAFCFFRGLAYPSTQQIVGGLNFRVRCGSGWFPAAMAAKTSLMIMTCMLYNAVCSFPFFLMGLLVCVLVCDCCVLWWLSGPFVCFGIGWAVSGCGLNASLPWRVRPNSIYPVFYWSPYGLFSGCFSGLDAFSPYNLARGCPARPVGRPVD
jgi:hypothetical protein